MLTKLRYDFSWNSQFLKHMTNNIKHLYNQSPIGVCVLRHDRLRMEVLFVNAAFAHMLVPPGGDPVGHEPQEFWPEAEMAALIRKLKSPTPPASHVLMVDRDSKGKRRWIKLTIQQDRFDGQDAYIIWATDISDSKEEEERLQHAVEAADATAEMKSNFLATMSHEIRTPMQSVYGLLELIGEEKPDARIMSMVNTAKTSASGLLEILDDILDFAKIDAAKMELDQFEVPVRTLVRGILEAMSVKVQGKNVALIDEIDKDVPFVIIGDPKRLRQVLMNLTGNALKFTAQGSVTVRVTDKVRTITASDRGTALRFEIIDTGIGLSAAAQKKLFQPFSQADSSTSRKFGGTGLGLSICKKLVELMGGQIGVDSIEGQGSTFWFEIPTEEVSTETTTVNLPKLDGISVLSVEDHPQGAREIVRSLESMGARVESCPTYKEGLELARRRPFDVAVIDQGLPDGLGLDLIREIMDIRPYMGLIMYTVRDDIGMQHSLNALGVTYLSKPASRIGLGEAIRGAARRTASINIDGPTRLLIAEDTPSVRDVLQRQLDKLGVAADFVNDGKAALQALESGKYGILFTDLHMPEMDGYDLVETIRAQEAGRLATQNRNNAADHMPVVVLTADVQMAQRQTYMAYGFDECLLKPVSLGHFRRLLVRWGLLAAGDDDEMDEDTKPAGGDSGDTQGKPPAIDRACIVELMGALDDNTVQMMQMFADMTAPLIARLQKARAENDLPELREAAHSLKGAARSACCNLLGDLASQLQDDAEAGKSGCVALVAAIEDEFKRACAAIADLRAE